MILGAKYGLRVHVIKPNSDNIYALSVHSGAVSCIFAICIVAILTLCEVNTAMQQHWKDTFPGITGALLTNAMLTSGRNPEQVSYSTLWALTDPSIEEKDLYYFADPRQPGKETAQASDPALGAALWDLITRLAKKKVGEDASLEWNGGDRKN